MDRYNCHIFRDKTVKILTCYDCNIRCKHCYILFKENFDVGELAHIVDDLSKEFEVRINGTEPLLYKEYLQSIKRAHQTVVLTNELLFKDNYSYIDELEEYGVDTICISYRFDFHDDISSVNKHYLEKLFEIIIDKVLDVQIMSTITSKNYKKILEYCKFCQSLEIRKTRFTNFMLENNATNLENSLILMDDERQGFFEIIDKARNIYPEELLKITRCGSFGKNINSSKRFYCGG